MGDTTYVPQIFVQDMDLVEGPNASGTGSPEGVVGGYPGYTYLRTSNNAFYVKTSGLGTLTGWVEITGGGGGGTTQVATGTGVPVDEPFAGTVLYVDTDTADIYFWNGSAWI